MRRFLPGVLLVVTGALVTAAPWPAPEPVRARHFATAQVCATCHSNADGARAMRDSQKRGVSPFDLWQATMMANASRDPLWRAYVSVEVAQNPEHKSAIEAKCTRCHAPLASAEAEVSYGAKIGLATIDDDGPLGQLARDGVSCTICHQIQDKGLGTPESWSGHYKAGGPQEIYGPHDNVQGRPMRMHTDYTPRFGSHVSTSAMCATCHNLFTEAFDADGKPSGRVLPEQTPYLEWRNSVFNDEVAEPGPDAKSCQDCHMPTADVDGKAIRTGIARNPGGRDFGFVRPREPFGRHRIVGGNTLVPAILRDSPLRAAPKEAYDAVIAEARSMLRRRTARVRIEQIHRNGTHWGIGVRVTNRTGHKFPTGIPIRRAWLRLRVRDKAGKFLLRWFDFDQAGRIVGADGKPLPGELLGGPTAPHRDRVSGPTEVPIYETVLEDTRGKVTFTLLHGAKYRKDNRLLPRGWDPEHEHATTTAPAGIGNDGNFTGGRDLVFLEFPAIEGADSVEVDLLYQTLGARNAAELFEHDTPEVAVFRRWYEKADRRPVIVAADLQKLR